MKRLGWLVAAVLACALVYQCTEQIQPSSSPASSATQSLPAEQSPNEASPASQKPENAEPSQNAPAGSSQPQNSTPYENDRYYTNSEGNRVHSPEYAPTAPVGATAQCEDGAYSFSQHRPGTCSHHGGVAIWLQ
jgi:hypothetical protein